MRGLIVGIDIVDGCKLYRVILFDYSNKNWKFNRQRVTEEQLIGALVQGKIRLTNAKVEGGKIKGTTGDLKRFQNRINKPLVIISELVVDGRGVLGYKVANYEGTVKNVSRMDMLKLCDKVSKAGGIPLQNGQYVADTNEQRAHIRSYPGGDYIKEVIERTRSRHARPASVDTTRNTKALEKLEELFTPEQIRELMIGKKNGVNIKIYGNNKLSADQMRVIREALEEGLNAKLFADPDYSVDAMRILRADMKYGVDVSYYLNPKYSAEQLSELATGYISGVDVDKYSDPNNTPEEMAEIRMRLENNIWKELEVDRDESWK